MRKILLTKFMLLMSLLLVGAGSVWGAEVTFTAGTNTGSTSVTIDGITVSMSTMSRDDNYRCYSGSTMTITSTIGNITNVTITCTGSGTNNYGPGKFSLASGSTGTYSYSGKVGTWTGNAESFSLTASAQVRMTSIVVTVSSTKTSTTTTIDAKGLTNTDIYTSTNAGTLTATVAAGETTLTGASVTWSSSDTDVATIGASTGVVTLVGEGTVTFTATYAGDDTYAQSSATTASFTITNSIPVTTTTIDATGITNTDVYNGTAAGQLAATVKVGDDVVSGAAVTWASSNENLATIDANGTVTLVAKGTVTFTASYAGDATHKESSATYEMTITDSTPFSGSTIDFESDLDTYTDWTFTNINLNNSKITANGGDKYGVNANENDNGTTTASIVTNDKIAAPGDLTFYVSRVTSNTTSSTWYVQVSSDGSNWTDVTTQDAKIMTAGTWVKVYADLSSYTNVYVRIYYSGSSAIRTIDDIELTVAASVKTPTFSVAEGTYTETQSVTITCETSGASIYYTTDGATPTNASTLYTGAISVSETTTIKAIAYVGEEASNVATVTYTFPTAIANIAALKAAGAGTYRLTLTDAQVLYVGTNDMYIQDATGAVDLYKCEQTYTAGQTLNGSALVTYTVYNLLPEITSFAAIGTITATDGTATAETVAVADATIADYVCHLISVTGTLTVDGSNYYLSDGTNELQIYNKYSVDGITLSDLTAGNTYTATGILIPYNSNPELALTAIEAAPTTATITLNSACTDGTMIYGTYSNSSAFVVSDDIVVSEISLVDGQLFVDDYASGAVVPANTGVMVSALNDGTTEFTVNLSSEAGTSVLGSYNCLRATGDGITATAMAAADADCKYYRLTMHNADTDNEIGFWWGAAEGAAFAVAANKAYLAVPTSAGAVKGFALSDLVDAIKAVDTEKAESKVIYNLAGQRVSKMQKGIYIVNGKKIFNK